MSRPLLPTAVPAPARRTVLRGALSAAAVGAAGGTGVLGADRAQAAPAVRTGVRPVAGPVAGPVAAPGRSAARGTDADVLVLLTLRGGFDALTAVVPTDDDELRRRRPTLAVPSDLLLPLDSRFGLHPALEPLRHWWREGSLAVVHAVGQPGSSRSHGLASARLDAGGTDVRGGWLGRAFAGTDPWQTAYLGSASAPGALAGAAGTGLRTARQLDLTGLTGTARDRWLAGLTALGAGSPTLKTPVARTVAALRAWPHPEPADPHGYPQTGLGRSLSEAANLVRADLGVRAICVEHGGWDLHSVAGRGDQADDEQTRGPIGDLLAELAQALHAFAEDLGDDLGRVTLVTVSEFGRRVDENGSGGTGHGSAGAMLLLGGGVDGGERVAGDWPGLAPDRLDHGGLKVVTDHRQVLAEVLQRRCGVRTADVFPGMATEPLGVVHPR